MESTTLSPLQSIKHAYDKILKFEEDDELIVDCFVAVMTAAFHPKLHESLWFYFIGPPGSGKTETVLTMRGHGRCLLLTTPTENALISGYGDESGQDPSLILKLNNNVLIWKDFTALMEAGKNLVDKVLGEFRDLYDQYCSKASGKVGVREYEASFGMIACVTDVIDGFMEKHQQLGQRFLSIRINRLRLTHTQRVENLGRVIAAMQDKKEWKEWLRKVVQGNMNRIIKSCKGGQVPVMPEEMEEDIKIMADLLALMRTAPSNDTAVRPELATRIVQQLINLGAAHAFANGRDKWNDSDMVLVRRVVLDSLSLVRHRLVLFLFQRGKHRPAAPLGQLAQACRTTSKGLAPIVNQFVFGGLLEGQEGGGGEIWYKLTADIYQSLEKTKMLKWV